MHTSFKKGTPVMCMLKRGGHILGKFVERKSRYIIVETNDGKETWVSKRDMRAVAVVKNQLGVA